MNSQNQKLLDLYQYLWINQGRKIDHEETKNTKNL